MFLKLQINIIQLLCLVMKNLSHPDSDSDNYFNHESIINLILLIYQNHQFQDQNRIVHQFTDKSLLFCD